MDEEQKPTKWVEKINDWYNRGFPMNNAVSAFLEHKEKTVEEICNIIETVKIPEYYARIESYKTKV